MPVAAEVNAFEGEIGGDQDVCGLTCEGGLAQDGAVVADAGLKRGIFCALGCAANLRNQRFFGKGHGKHYRRG